jgi:hypothetical protein
MVIGSGRSVSTRTGRPTTVCSGRSARSAWMRRALSPGRTVTGKAPFTDVPGATSMPAITTREAAACADTGCARSFTPIQNSSSAITVSTIFR